MADRTKRGRNGKTYRNTGTIGSPTWNLIDRVRNCSMDTNWDTVEAHDRADGEKAHSITWIDRTITLTMAWHPDDADVVALHTAFEAGTAVQFAFCDAPIATTGTYKFTMECYITKFTRSQDLNENQLVEIELKRADTDTAPAWVVVS